MKTMAKIIWITAIALLVATNGVEAAKVAFTPPSDDRWHYWINTETGIRHVASTFAAPGWAGINGEFNDRDAVVILVWDTSTIVQPGLGPENYNVTSIGLTVTNVATAEWDIDLTVDEWDAFDLDGDGFINADGFPRGHASDTDGESDDVDPGRPIELYGAGFGPTHNAVTWTEFSSYQGASFSGAPFFGDPVKARDPFPFVYQDGTLDLLHVEDNIRGLHNDMLANPVFEFTPQPWAIGLPIGYTPITQSVPFDIVFDVDLSLSGGEVKRYFQEQLDAGRVFLIVSSLQETTQQASQEGYPGFYTKEATAAGAKPAELRIELSNAPGDFDGDGDVDLVDYVEFPDCLTGPGGGIVDGSCVPFDFDTDMDVDLQDYAAFTRAFGN
jgi:hypothetical protein